MWFARHTLVDLTPAARAALAEVVGERLLPPFRRDDLRRRVGELFASHAIPGIACRPTEPIGPDVVQLGVSFPFRDDGARVRALIAVPVDVVAGHRSAYDVVLAPRVAGFPFAELLEGLQAVARDNDVRLGVFGSAALHLSTGLDYVGRESDLDLVVMAAGVDGLANFVAAAGELGRRHSVRIDTEVQLVNGYGVKAKELCSTSRTVLGRSLADVRLLRRDEALAAIGVFATEAIHGLPPTLMPTRREQWN
jgi:phosphoribosyl-dephospho-CoA transferase